jgi:N-acetylglucosaminyl-diphospho-decaprenol L-rhamnosyltransferase
VTEFPKVSITIVVHNSARWLETCLRSIRSDLASGFAELLVVDNASPDDSMAIVAREWPPARSIDAGGNRGFAGGCNLAWPSVRGRYWLLLNPDVLVPEGGLRHLVEWMDREGEIGAASPELIDEAGRRRSVGQRAPSLGLVFIEMLRLHRLLPAAVRARWLRGAYWRAGDQRGVDWIPGTALLARREAVEGAGLLSERFFMYGEDIEWCWRIRRAGWRIGVCGSVAFRHLEGGSSDRTWGREGTLARMAAGIVSACRAIRGPRYARAYATAQAAALALESCLPHRSTEERARARGFARAFRRAASAQGTPHAGLPRRACSTRA